MFNSSETIATALILLVALGILVWGFNRARPYGKIGILSWLQSVVLMAPWLLFFGLFAAGIYLNIIGILFLIVASAGAYIYLGNRLRAAGQETILRERATERLKQQDSSEAENTTSTSEATETSPESENQKTTTSQQTPPIPQEDLQTIQEIFGIDTFYATETIPYKEGAIFQGNLRGEPEQVYSKLSANLEERFGEKYRLFLVENPEGKPVAIVLPSSNDPQPATPAQKVLALLLLVATFVSSIEAFSLLLGFDFFNNLGRFREAVPLSLGLWFLLGAHEMGHRIFAQRYNQRLSFPFFIPSVQIGSFGAITRFESLLPTRRALFDIALAGPAAGGIVSLLMLVTGLLLSHSGSTFQVPTEFFQGSILVGSLARVTLGSELQASLVDVHPFTVIGWLGLVITALNLMPAGQLDGGRVVQAIYGRKTTRRTTVATLVVLGIIAIVNPSNPIPLYWGILILFLQRTQERPSLNELTEPDDARAALGLLALFLMLATLIPLSPGLAGRLGIGV
ncbi:MAG: site-2 protease family protein [Cyanobacteria bacterium QH_8_48_120]|jgi:membrane-associated protease RseP (regulator of RpoE activity)|nr:MAG: site-2 protease family protein [Cyanobacteria bacterium QH_1_48_107]PSO58575.1 MAG: site-2 protease family protein [Cyanobacteria bacterium QH_7_48_89]PSO67238.1 MAG: site-2 protease family protein [Cyanobacteria bacterium QH_6_48_35]PSO70454.1 MAG: site-2 protease family protein [Cyanobacteria bacterium QH_8_48_120]PSO79821.1 MAG: site-2 protease family protein [Cyanobacteria bacterium QS_4_48_99]PSO93946.1 MAG: site-2 protease family protein [Cyanobacteria bacterium QS_9_48_30]PSP10